LNDEIQVVEKENGFLLEDQRAFLKRNEQERRECDEQKAVMINLERKVREEQLLSQNLSKDLEGMRGYNDALMDRNHELKQELEALQTHADLLGGQNLELQRELDSFVETDEQVRKNLDRKDRIQSVRYQVETSIKRSEEEVYKARSPAKRNTFSGSGSGSNFHVQPAHVQAQSSQVQFQTSSHNQSQFNASRFERGRGSPLRSKHLD